MNAEDEKDDEKSEDADTKEQQELTDEDLEAVQGGAMKEPSEDNMK